MYYGSTVVQVSGQRSSTIAVDGDPRDPWVRLEQVKPRGLDKALGMAMLHQMWLNAATGNSAAMLQFLGCPIEVRGSKIHVFLDFYAWPYSPDLVYTLEAAHGNIINRRGAAEQREFSVFVNHDNIVLLPYYMPMVSAQWLTDTFNTDGEVVPKPKITNHKTWLELDAEVFGVIRIRGVAQGELATCEMIIDKPVTSDATTDATAAGWYDAPGGQTIYTPAPTETQNSAKISNLKNTVTASWVVCVDDNGGFLGLPEDIEGECNEAVRTERLSLEIPECVENFLELCPDMYQIVTLICEKAYTLTVYYDACRGEVIKAIPTDPKSYCSKSVGTASPFTINASRWLK